MRGRVSSAAGLLASCANPLGPLVMGLLLLGSHGVAMPVFGAVVGVGTVAFLVCHARLGDADGDADGDAGGREKGAHDRGTGADPAGSRR
jgi:hypothetical protein